jgi:TIR domain
VASAFVSYVKEDSDEVDRIRVVLQEFQIDVWLDKTALKPGLRWQDQIRSGITEGDFFLACFSKTYVERQRTYMNEELTLVIEELRLRPTDRAWFIPVKLSACEIPDRSIGAGETLRSIQWVNLYDDWTAGMEKVLSVMVPGSERIPRLISQLDHQSARRRIEAIEALGRLGPVAKMAVPKLLERIPVESRSRTGLSPLAAIRDALMKIGHMEKKTFTKIKTVFKKWRVNPSELGPPF